MKYFASYMMLAALLCTGAAVRAQEREGGDMGPRPAPRPVRMATTTPMRRGDDDRTNASSTRDILPPPRKDDGDNKDKQPELGNMIERFDATFDRMQNLITRTESRVAKMKSAGKDTAAAEKAIAEAKSKLLESQTMFESLKGALATSTIQVADMASSSGRISKDAMKKFKKVTDQITKNLRIIQTNLLKALGGDDRGKNDQDSNATSSPRQTIGAQPPRKLGSSTPERRPAPRPEPEETR